MNIIRSLLRKTECPFFYDYKTVQQALRFMRSHGCVQVPVVNQDGRYLGTVSEGDFLWHIIDWGGYEAATDHKIAELLRRGIMHDFYVRPGRHNNEYWGNSIDYQIVFFRNFFFRDK